MKNLLKKTDTLITIIFFLLVFCFYLNKITQLRYHADEYEWVGRSYFFDLLIRNDFGNKLWQSHFSYDHPKLVYYLYGAILYPIYVSSNEQSYFAFLEKYKLFQTDTKTIPIWEDIQHEFTRINWDLDNLPKDCLSTFCKSTILIDKIRLANVFLLSLSGFFVYLISRLISNKILSIFITFIWATNSIIIGWGLPAIGEASFLLFFNLSIYLLLKILCNKRYDFLNYLFLSIAIALCFSSKIHGLLLFFIAIFSLFIELFRNFILYKMKFLIKDFFNIILVIVIFISVTILLNPFLWENPYTGIKKLFDHRLNTAKSQQVKYPLAALYNSNERLKSIYIYLIAYKKNLENNTYSRNDNLQIFTSFFLLLIGIYKLISESKNKKIFFYFTLIVVILILFMSNFLLLSWERYYNILVLPYILILFLGISTILKNIPSTFSTFKNYFSTKVFIKSKGQG